MHQPEPSHILIAQPPAPQQLFLLYHGVGDSAQGLAPLGEFIAAHFPQAFVVCIDSPHHCDFAAGYQWYSLQEATEENRHERVMAEMPLFIDSVRHWQQRTGIGPEATCIIGFSQGAFMALQSSQQPQFLAGRIVALAGRFTQVPELPQQPVVLHLIHGAQDSVVAHHHTTAAGERLQALGADCTFDLIEGLAHGIDNAMAQCIIERLTRHVPKRLWDEAMRSAGE